MIYIPPPEFHIRMRSDKTPKYAAVEYEVGNTKIVRCGKCLGIIKTGVDNKGRVKCWGCGARSRMPGYVDRRCSLAPDLDHLEVPKN